VTVSTTSTRSCLVGLALCFGMGLALGLAL
jgi:hypothetical protein